MNAPDLTAQEAKAGDRPSLKPEAIKRLRELLGKIASMHLAVKHLSDHEDWEGTCCAVSALQNAMGDRLHESVNLVYRGNEEGN